MASISAPALAARSENIELEIHRAAVFEQEGILRLPAYVNHANMGSYRQAIENFQAGLTPVPDITAHPLQTTVKYGFGANFEQPFNDWLGLFGRWGWNEGQHETYAFTEVDQTWQIGVGGNGARWHRHYDRVGFVFVSNGISREHQQYLALGGNGFLLGDGKLNYGLANSLELFYTVQFWRGIFPAVGLQYAVHPGYSRDRGPVLVPTLRLPLEF